MNSTRSSLPPLQLSEQRRPFTSPSQVVVQSAELNGRLQSHWSSLVIIVTITITTIVGTIVWVLNSLGILHIIWAGVIGAVLSAIGILLALWPLDSQRAIQSKDQVIDSLNTLHAFPRKTSLWTRKKRGGLHIIVRRQLRHSTITLHRGFNQAHRPPDAATSISEQLVDGESIYIGTFLSVEPGNYTVATQNKEYVALVTIYPENTKWIDWR